ncbi:hypothetical protein ACLOJK_017022 [Asimina triloba]
MAAEFDSPSDSGKVSGIALEFPACESTSPTKVPRRIRQRLLESSPPPSASTLKEIEAKLREADLRRQQFHEWLSNKARPKPRSPSWSSQDEDLAQRLEARLYAAEQKRMNMLAKAQMRLARLDELRQAAKNGVELRYEKEREKLGSKVESRVQQAELNRMLLLKACKQKRAAAQERTAQSLLQRRLRENKYKELVHTAMCQKRAAAEKKRLGLLEAEKKRAHARVMQARWVAKTVCHQREIERRRLKDQLEDRLQRARRQRAEYLRLRGSSYTSAHFNWRNMKKHGDFLSRKLARCWRQFLRSRRTTLALAKAFEDLSINEKSVRSMPFEQLAVHIESASTLQTVKALLDRLESRYMLSQATPSTANNIDHLLKRLASPKRKGRSYNCSRTKGTKKGSNKETKSPEVSKLSRYPTRVVLCAYMILGHPDAVFSGQGEPEVALAEAAANFIQEFELLVKIIIDGPSQTSSAGSSRQSSPDIMSSNLEQEEPSQLPSRRTFRSQLATFDTAWCSYLYRFVLWKVKDARSLEDDLVRAACQLELSMMQTCKLTAEGDSGSLTHDMRAIQKQVSEDQKLLREKVQHLSGSAGVDRMEYALSDTRSKYFEAKENGSPSMSPIAHISSSTPSSSLGPSTLDLDQRSPVESGESSSHVVRSLFRDAPSSSKVAVVAPRNLDAQISSSTSEKLVTENEVMVNEILHAGPRAFADSFHISNEDQFGIKAKIKETMEKAFWDGIAKSMKEDDPDYGQVVLLVKEVRDELHEMAPQNWKQEIDEIIDIDILSQVLKSGIVDMGYLGRILEFSLSTLRKLSAPVKEEEMKKIHNDFLNKLAEMAHTDRGSNSSFVVTTIKGLRFVLEQIQELKREISKARIQMMEPFIKGPAGFEYLQKAFADRYGHPSDAARSLPLTAQWLLSVGGNSELEWEEHKDSLSALGFSNAGSTQALQLPTSLRTGGSVPLAGSESPMSSNAPATVSQLPECNGRKVDVLVRLGLLKMVSSIEGISKEGLPETLQLNFARLRAVQSQLQKIIVISTSVLVLRQILLSEPATNSTDVEAIVSDSVKRLSSLLDLSEDAGIIEIVETTTAASEEENANSTHRLQARKKVMASMLVKSLQAGDPVFSKVSQAVYLAARAVVLGGNTSSGRKLAEASLRRVGSAALTDVVVEAAEVLVVAAMVTGHVHGPWYSVLKMQEEDVHKAKMRHKNLLS